MKNRFKKNRKTIHNQNKPFNPNKYGKVWSSIKFDHNWNTSANTDTPSTIGTLQIGGKSVDLTFSEINKLMETLTDAKHVYKVGTRLGRSNSGW